MDYNKIILDIIKEEVADYYNIPSEYLKMNIKERKKNNINVKGVSTARRIAMYLSMKLTTIDSVIIANSFGIYDDDRMSARAFIVYTTYDFDKHDFEPEINKLKPICEKKINKEIKRIIKSVDIVDIVKNYIQLEKRGKDYFGICPFHKDNKSTLFVSQENQIYKCLICGASGNVRDFVDNYDIVKSNERLEKYFGSD